MALPGQVIADLEFVSADPAAGAQYSYTFAQDMQIYEIAFRLATDANVANRSVKISIATGANTYFRTYSTFGQAASTTMDYHGFSGSQMTTAAISTAIFPWPVGGLAVRAGDVLTSTILAGQVGDDFSPFVIHGEVMP